MFTFAERPGQLVLLPVLYGKEGPPLNSLSPRKDPVEDDREGRSYSSFQWQSRSLEIGLLE